MKIMIIIALIFLPRLLEAQGNLIFNGSFNTNADGWTLSGLAYFNVKNGNPSPDVVLENGTLNQTISSLDSGMVYAISGDYQGTPAGSSINYSISVTLNGVAVFYAPVPTDLNWAHFEFQYTATSSSAIISISQINQPDVGYSVDNVAMYAVPEPSTLSFLFLGSGILFYVRPRNKKHSKPMSSD
jgi:PEP-CTERM motif